MCRAGCGERVEEFIGYLEGAKKSYNEESGFVSVTDEKNRILLVDKKGGVGLFSHLSYRKMQDWSNRSTEMRYPNVRVYTKSDYYVQVGQHVMVAALFHRDQLFDLVGVLDDEHEFPQVNHKNGCIEDNDASNLEWVTRENNLLHGNMMRAIKMYFPDMTYRYRNCIGIEKVALTKGFSAYDLEDFMSGSKKKIDKKMAAEFLAYLEQKYAA